MSEPLYESIGRTYTVTRQPDPRVAEQITDALGDARTVLNVGAGAGSYEPADRQVVALDPSSVMLGQRTNANPPVRGMAEALPFRDSAFDATLGVLTVHHWTDRNAGLAECRRVSERQVLFVYDVAVSSRFWLAEYFTTLATAPWELDAPTPESIGEILDVQEVRTVWIPHDCVDGFTGAFWNRPERYLDPDVQAGMSTLARLPDDERAAGIEALRNAIDSGEWESRHGHLRTDQWFDIGYRIAIAHP